MSYTILRILYAGSVCLCERLFGFDAVVYGKIYAVRDKLSWSFINFHLGEEELSLSLSPRKAKVLGNYVDYVHDSNIISWKSLNLQKIKKTFAMCSHTHRIL